MKKYSNIFGCPKIYERISEYIRTGEMARIRIRIIFEGHFIRIFEYSNIRAHHWATVHCNFFFRLVLEVPVCEFGLFLPTHEIHA